MSPFDEVRRLHAELLRLQSRPIGEQLRDIAATLASTGRAVDAVELIGMALRVEYGVAGPTSQIMAKMQKGSDKT